MFSAAQACGRSGISPTTRPSRCLAPTARRCSSMPPATTTLRETSAPEETEAIGEELGRRLRKGDLVLLKGELGAGKTTFVRGMARGTGSSAARVRALASLGVVVAQELSQPARSRELVDRMRSMATAHNLAEVAVATGPGSFTGLRTGVSFGLGIAMGLRIPIVPLPTLGLQAARSHAPVLAVSEAGRGRVYYLEPAGRPGLAEPDELPRDWPVVSWLRPQTQAALEGAGL